MSFFSKVFQTNYCDLKVYKLIKTESYIFISFIRSFISFTVQRHKQSIELHLLAMIQLTFPWKVTDVRKKI